MKLPKFISNNLILKITSVNSVVIVIRLLISVFIQRILAIMVGEVGIAKVGQLRNAMSMLTSFTTLGTFNGIVKYLSENKNDQEKLQKLFSTTYVFVTIGSLTTMFLLFFGASFFARELFNDNSYTIIIQILAFVVPFIGLQRVFDGVINGLSAYKIYAKIELIVYIISSIILVIALYKYNLKGVLVAIAIVPLLYCIVLLGMYGNTLKKVIKYHQLKFEIPYKNELLAFALMSFVSTVLLNYIEIDLRNVITTKLNEVEAGYWTAMTNLSKNYMVFSTSIFSLYVLPKFASIHSAKEYKTEVLHIYKTLLPLFAVGMFLIYIFRDLIITIVYPNFIGLEPLFKWQLLADFVKLASVIIAHQFLAKKLIKAFIFSEIFSLVLFYALAIYLVDIYATKGVVIANFIRYVLYFILVIILLYRYFKNSREEASN